MAENPYPIPRETRQTDVLSGNGGVTYGPFGFKIFDTEDVEVITRAAGETAYSVASVTVAKVSGLALDHFTITFPAALPVTTAFQVRGRRVHLRAAGVLSGTRLSPDALEKELSKQAVTLEELRRDAPDIDPDIGDGKSLIRQGERLVEGPDAEQIQHANDDALAAQLNRILAQRAANEVSITTGLQEITDRDELEKYTYDDPIDETERQIAPGSVVVDRKTFVSYTALSSATPIFPFQNSKGVRWSVNAPAGGLDARAFGTMVPDTETPEVAAANSAAIQNALNFLKALPANIRTAVVVPAGRWFSSTKLDLSDNTDLYLYGAELVLTGSSAGAVLHARHCQNVNIYGGVLDGNFIDVPGGVNCFAASAPFADTLQRTKNIKLFGTTFKNAKRDASVPEFGNGGGKGATSQFGCDDIVYIGCSSLNCEIPFSVEGREASDGAMRGVRIAGWFDDGSSYGPYFAGNGSAVGYQKTQVIVRGLILHNTARGNFGTGALFNFHNANNIDVEATVLVTPPSTGSSKVSLLRGNAQYTKVTLTGSVVDLHDVVNTFDHAGLTSIATRGLVVDIANLNIVGNHQSYVHNCDPSLKPLDLKLNMTFRGTLTGLFTVTSNNYHFNLHDLDSGKRIVGEVSQLWGLPTERFALLAAAANLLGGGALKSDGTNLELALASGFDLLFKDSAGSPRFRIRDDETVIHEKLRLGTTGNHIIAWGTGDPNGAITASAPSVWIRLDGTAGSLLYLKESGTNSNTGWVAKW